MGLNNILDSNLFLCDEIKFEKSLQILNNELFDIENNINELYSNNRINNQIILTNYNKILYL